MALHPNYFDFFPIGNVDMSSDLPVIRTAEEREKYAQMKEILDKATASMKKSPYEKQLERALAERESLMEAFERERKMINERSSSAARSLRFNQVRTDDYGNVMSVMWSGEWVTEKSYQELINKFIASQINLKKVLAILDAMGITVMEDIPREGK